MRTLRSSARLAAAAFALVLAAAHGDASAQRKRPPPPPPPVADSNLTLVSTDATGRPVDGAVCGVSADGGKVLFQTRLGNFQAEQLWIKDFNGNTSTRIVVNSAATVRLACLGMTPDARAAVYVDGAPNGVADFLGREGVEPAILVRDLLSGAVTRITPPLSTLPGASRFVFAGISDDAQRVAFIAEPTFSCSLYNCVATGPTRMFVRDLSTGELVNLDDRVRLTAGQGQVDGNALLSPDGRSLAFSTREPYPELGDLNTNRSDVFVLDLASRAVRLVSADTQGQQLAILGFAATAGGPTYGVQSFLGNSTRVAFRSAADLNVGPANVYAKDLVTGALVPMLPAGVSPSFPNVNVKGVRADLSFSDDGQKVAFVQRSNRNPSVDVPTVIDLRTGARLNAATLTNGTVGNGPISLGMLLSRDGRATAFDNNSTNLVAGATTSVVRTYRRLLP
jgi:Tol biopolymer transport system component